MICRELRDLANTVQTQNLILLTDAQKNKLKALAGALKLVPVLGEAQMSNLLGVWATAPGGLNGYNTSANSKLLGMNAINGCSGTGLLVPRPVQ